MTAVKFELFADLYCKRQDQTPEGLKAILKAQKERTNPTGWMLLECVVLDSSRIGELTILPYGPNNTYQDVPDHPFSPRGLCSDISQVIATLDTSEV